MSLASRHVKIVLSFRSNACVNAKPCEKGKKKKPEHVGYYSNLGDARATRVFIAQELSAQVYPHREPSTCSAFSGDVQPAFDIDKRLTRAHKLLHSKIPVYVRLPSLTEQGRYVRRHA